MRVVKLGLSLIIAMGLFGVLLPNADAIIKSFGDSSFAYGTPVEDDGSQTVCSDGFELIAASTPNESGPDPIGIGLPTPHQNGDILVSPFVGVYDASLVDDYENPTILASFSRPDGFDLVDPVTGLIEPYGHTTVDIILADTYFALPPSDPPSNKAAEGIGSTMFVPDSLLPVGQDVVIVTGDYTSFGSHRRVTVIDCTPEPTEVEAQIKNDKVKPDRGFRRIRVHIINDGSFDNADVADLQVGGGSPFNGVVRMFDVDGDGDEDITFKTRTRDTDVACGDHTMTVTGTISGEPFATVVPINNFCTAPLA